MDAHAHLRGLGWRGSGHSLDSEGRGLKKPVLVGAKKDKVGLGGKQDFSDQWWLKALDDGLKCIGTGQQSVLSQVQKNGIRRGGLYGFFVKGSILGGTITEHQTSLKNVIRASQTSPSLSNADVSITQSLPDHSWPLQTKYNTSSIVATDAIPSPATELESDSWSHSAPESSGPEREKDSESKSALTTSDSDLSRSSPLMAKASKKRKADKGPKNAEKKTKKRKRAVSGNNGALAVPAATTATFEGAAATPNGPFPHAQAAGQSQSTGVDGVEPGEYGPNGYLYDPKPQKKATQTRAKTDKQIRQEQMRKYKKEKRQERKIKNQQKDAELKRFHRERKQKALLEKLKEEDPEKYANTSHEDLDVKTNAEIKADKKVVRDEKKEQKKLRHRMLARQKKQNEAQLKDDVIHGMDIEAAELSNRKRRMAERLHARLERVVEKKGGDITFEEAAQDIEDRRLQRKEQRLRKKEKKQQERKELKAQRSQKWAENQKKKTNWQKEKEDRLKAAAAGVPYDPAMTGLNAIAFKGLGGQRPLPEFKPPSLEIGRSKLEGLADDKRKQYEARAKEKGISLEAYAARRAEKKEQKKTNSADLP
ncbi:MAG: hypothetical protein Q9165_006888 [Trypethelium subeluteriae]